MPPASLQTRCTVRALNVDPYSLFLWSFGCGSFHFVNPVCERRGKCLLKIIQHTYWLLIFAGHQRSFIRSLVKQHRQAGRGWSLAPAVPLCKVCHGGTRAPRHCQCLREFNEGPAKNGEGREQCLGLGQSRWFPYGRVEWLIYLECLQSALASLLRGLRWYAFNCSHKVEQENHVAAIITWRRLLWRMSSSCGLGLSQRKSNLSVLVILHCLKGQTQYLPLGAAGFRIGILMVHCIHAVCGM